jgi:hypothetical protein
MYMVSHDVVGRSVVHLNAQKDDAVFEQLGVGVVPLEAIGGALFKFRKDVARLRKRNSAGS